MTNRNRRSKPNTSFLGFARGGGLFRLVVLAVPALASAENWPQWRGPRGDGTCLEKGVPVEWNVQSNCAWKTELPGAAHSSPIIWGDRLFTATALREKGQRILLSLERKTGKILWEQLVLDAPLEKKNRENSYASGTPASDGEKVYTAFLGGQDVVVSAYDFSGKQVWQSRPGQFASPHGYSGSPILFKDKVIVVGDNTGESWVAALARTDGKTLWKTPRERSNISFGTPLIRELAGRNQMFIAGNTCVTSYDPNDGSRIWFADGPSDQAVASTVYSELAGLLIVTGGYPQRFLLAIKPDGSGNVSQTHVTWRNSEGVAYVPSPVLVGEYLLTVTPNAVMYCLEAATGKVLWKEKVVKHHASPVSANGLAYFIDDKGQINVIKPGPTFERVGQHELGEATYASPALSEGQVFVRGEKSLFCIGKAAKR